MFMCLASAGGTITPTGIRIMVSYLDQTGLEHTLKKLRNQIYPVGSLYFSTNSTSPATIYGGTWERYGKGRTLVSVNESDTDFTAGKTGGEKTVVHAHFQTIGGGTNNDPTVYFGGDVAPDTLNGTVPAYVPNRRNWQANRVSQLHRDAEHGNAQFVETETHQAKTSTLQPYVAVYIWRRTA